MKTEPIIDVATSCNTCGCSHLRVQLGQDPDDHIAPFYCLHPMLAEARKVRKEERPLTTRPEWCPLDELPVLIKAGPR